MIRKITEAKVPLEDIPEGHKGGNCYKIAFDTLLRNPSYKLVHGVVTGQGAIEGIQYSHAWVEDGDKIIDNTLSVNLRELPKELYYALGNIQIVRKYTYKQALDKALSTGHYGPWDKVFDDYN